MSLASGDDMDELDYISNALSDAGIDFFRFYNALDDYISIKDQIVFAFDDAGALVDMRIGDARYRVEYMNNHYAKDPFFIEELSAFVATKKYRRELRDKMRRQSND